MSQQSITSELPDICGAENQVSQAMAKPPSPLEESIFRGSPRGGFAIALHMHQPLIPAGGPDLRSAGIISNLQYMFEHPEIQDAHNASVFRWCYQRMGDFIPQLLAEGKQPRVMLDYSGCLLHGLQQMGANDLLEKLKHLAHDSACIACVEWLGTAWGHAVAPSTPAQDFRLHVRAWQQHFASIFGYDALSRVRGFSLPEMALPNHPDVAYQLIQTLRDCGYRWLLVQEHTIEMPDGAGVRQPHVPHRLVATNSAGQSTEMIAIIKTQGSDTKLVAQMQPYFHARELSPLPLNGRSIPQLVTQIGDGENGGVMMNEFPPMFFRTTQEASGTQTPPMNVSEYLAYLLSQGIGEYDFPIIQPIFQKRIWDRFEKGSGPTKLKEIIDTLAREDHRFHMEGGSWTSDTSWVRGYENLLGPMESASAMFAEKILRAGVPTTDPRYRNALFHLMLSQTSCFRYWGQGQWTDYGKELCRRTMEKCS